MIRLGKYITVKLRVIILSFIVFAMQAPNCAYAEDTIPKLYADTFKLESLGNSISEDDLFFVMLEQQKRQLLVRDSLANDSLLALMLEQDSLIRIQIEQLQQLLASNADSISKLKLALNRVEVDTIPEVEPVDSLLLTMQNETDSLIKNLRIDKRDVERSIFKDIQEDLNDVNRSLHRKRYWNRELNCLAQITQNYISPNWYKGGNSTFAGLAQLKGFYNYKKDKLTWENSLEWKLGISTTGASDTLRGYTISDDLFRVQTKVGYQIAKNLYVSGSMELNTTLWNSWNANKNTMKTSSFTPLKYYINAGIDYQPVKGLSINVSPAVYKLTYAYRHNPEQVDVTNFGIEAGNYIRNEFGSSIRATWKYKPVREVAIDTEFNFYTNYRGVELDWEINCDFIINRFLASRLTLHPRYSTSEIAEGDKHPQVQFKELLSIGFSHKFH